MERISNWTGATLLWLTIIAIAAGIIVTQGKASDLPLDANGNAMEQNPMIECPHCHQAMLMRFGIKFEPKRAAILDMIHDVTKGRGGISTDSLLAVFYPGASKKSAGATLRVHISEINSMLVSTDWKIINRDGLYRLVEQANA